MSNALGIALPAIGVEAHEISTTVFTNIGNYQREIKVLAYTAMAQFAHGVMIPAMTKYFEELTVKEGKLEKRWMVNICYTVDLRYSEFDESLSLFFDQVNSNEWLGQDPHRGSLV